MNEERFLLDTHIWFRYLTFPKLLRPASAKAIDRAVAQNAAFISVISIWELAMLERDGRLDLYEGIEQWQQQALSRPGIAVAPFSPQIAIASVKLTSPMHKDPADRIIVATARSERMTLVTSDKAVLKFAKTTNLPHIRG